MAEDYWKMRKAYAQMNGTAAREQEQQERARREGPLLPAATTPTKHQYRLLGRIESLDEGFFAIASAVPEDSKAAVLTMDRRDITTRDEAETAMHELVKVLGAHLRLEGHSVVDVETDGA